MNIDPIYIQLLGTAVIVAAAAAYSRARIGQACRELDAINERLDVLRKSITS